MCVLSIKVPIRKKSGNIFNDPRRCSEEKDKMTHTAHFIDNLKNNDYTTSIP